MISISLEDKNVAENVKAILELRKSGFYTDAEIQKLYDKQVEADKRSDTE